MRSNKVYFWACDYKSNSGEGRLARLYINEYKKKSKNLFIKIPPPRLKILNYKYISPYIGIFYAWVYFFKRKQFLFLNYLPCWNFLTFLLLPPKSKIGPITGGSNFSKNSNDYLIRKFFFPILYFFSDLVLRFRFDNLIFSTDLLKKFLSKKIINKSKFNFIFNEIKIKKQNTFKKRKIKFLFYFRKHKNKKYLYIYNILNELVLKNYEPQIIGDKLILKGVKNHGFISHNKVLNLLNDTKYSLTSTENLYSFFTIDCINNNVKVLVDNKKYRAIKYYKHCFVKYKFIKNKLFF